MSRADLLALTPEALTRLANVGLVKRAQKELAAGGGPTLVEELDGTVVAKASDGATTRLPRGMALPQTTCSCGAAQVCRHRLAAVLAYQAEHAAPVGTTSFTAWDPGAISDEAMLAACGAKLVERAEAAMAHGLVVTVRPGIGATVPAVALPTATVQFLVPGDLAYAKCDCAKGHHCEHVVLAVRAFRVGAGVITLRSSAAPTSLAPSSARGVVDAALVHLAEQGLVAPGTAAALAQARAAAEREHWWWIVDGLAEIERLAEAYHRQSATFRLEALAQEVGELVARTRSAFSSSPALPASYVLGSDHAGETAMEQVRLLALGARLDADEDRRSVRLYFADPDTGAVLALDRTWTGETRNGPDLGALFASSRMSVADLARGELVTRAARRRPNGALDLGAARGMKSSLLPSPSSWSTLPEPLLVRDLAAHAARRRANPPACLSPRGLGSAVAVVQLGAVVEVDRASDGQSVMGLVEDPAGNRLLLHAEHRRVAPGAVDALADALAAHATFVAGELRLSPHGWSMEPFALLTNQLVVVDLARPRKGPAPEARGIVVPPVDPAARLASSIREYVAHALLRGARTAGPSARLVAQEAEQLYAHRLGALLARAATGAVPAILDLAVLHQLDDA